MAMRLYHRRSSATRDKIQLQNAAVLAPGLAARLQNLSNCAAGNPGPSRQRSQSLFPGSIHSLGIPARSRSQSFSGPSEPPLRTPLTDLEEEHIFRCYTRVMYVTLGVMVAVAVGLLYYGMRNFTMLS